MLVHVSRFSRIQKEAGIKSPAAADEPTTAAAAVAPGVGGLLDELLEGEFDPEEYDRRMAEAFNDQYYQVGSGCDWAYIFDRLWASQLLW